MKKISKSIFYNYGSYQVKFLGFQNGVNPISQKLHQIEEYLVHSSVSKINQIINTFIETKFITRRGNEREEHNKD